MSKTIAFLVLSLEEHFKFLAILMPDEQNHCIFSFIILICLKHPLIVEFLPRLDSASDIIIWIGDFNNLICCSAFFIELSSASLGTSIIAL